MDGGSGTARVWQQKEILKETPSPSPQEPPTAEKIFHLGENVIIHGLQSTNGKQLNGEWVGGAFLVRVLVGIAAAGRVASASYTYKVSLIEFTHECTHRQTRYSARVHSFETTLRPRHHGRVEALH